MATQLWNRGTIKPNSSKMKSFHEKTPHIYLSFWGLKSSGLLNGSKKWRQTDTHPPYHLSVALLMDLFDLITSHKIYGKPEIDFEKIRSTKQYVDFCLRTCELQKVSLKRLSSTEKRCFVLNVYNLLLLHAFVVRTVPPFFFGRPHTCTSCMLFVRPLFLCSSSSFLPPFLLQ